MDKTAKRGLRKLLIRLWDKAKIFYYSIEMILSLLFVLALFYKLKIMILNKSARISNYNQHGF